MANINGLIYAVVAFTLALQPITVNTQNVLEGTFAVLERTLQPNVTNATDSLEKVSAKCYWDTAQYMEDFFASETYASRMYFSSGSYREDSEVTWNVKDVGDFTMCKTTYPRQSRRSFSSKYCLTDTAVDPTYSLTMGVCFPNSCTDVDIQILVLVGFREGYPFGELPFWAYTTTTCSPDDYPLTPGDAVASLICLILLILIVVSTVYDLVRRRKQKEGKVTSSNDMNLDVQNPSSDVTSSEGIEGNERTISSEILVEEPTPQPPTANKNKNKSKSKLSGVLLAFSVIDSGGKILNTTPSKGGIGCLNGIRVLSMFWIILFHTWLILASGFSYIENPRYMYEVVRPNSLSAILVFGELGVEAFFVLGGLLVTYLTLKNVEKFGKPRNPRWCLQFFLHRYWRLTPAYAFILMMYSTLVVHMGDGIWWPYWYGSQIVCHTKWWANLLYINNLYPFPGSTSECMGWSWYLSVDMQLYMLSPVFISLFYWKWVVGLTVSVITAVCSFAISAGLIFGLGRALAFDPSPYGEPTIAEGAWLYTKPYYRISQYLIGICLGYVLFRLKGKNVRINKILNAFLWFCSTVVAVLVVYGQYMKYGEDPRPQGVAILYMSIHRFLLSACIGWVIFACATGNGGPVNAFLSWGGWLPLARMNYCAYLLHLTVILMYTWGLKHLWYFTVFDLTLVFIGITVITYAAAFLVTMAIEIPMISLEKVLMPNKDKKAFRGVQDQAQTTS